MPCGHTRRIRSRYMVFLGSLSPVELPFLGSQRVPDCRPRKYWGPPQKNCRSPPINCRTPQKIRSNPQKNCSILQTICRNPQRNCRYSQKSCRNPQETCSIPPMSWGRHSPVFLQRKQPGSGEMAKRSGAFSKGGDHVRRLHTQEG